MRKFLPFLFLVFLCFVKKETKATIVYSGIINVNIDANGTNFVSYPILGYSLDLNHNGFSIDGFSIQGDFNVQGLVDPALNLSDDLLKKLPINTLIGPAESYITPSAFAPAYHTESMFGSPLGYCLANNQETYFGFRILNGLDTYYGWIQVRRINSDIVRLISYAYENTPNTPILAGQSSIPVASITVTGTGGANTITVDNGTLQMLATVLPTNANNQTITWSVTNQTGTATISAGGLLTALTNGTVNVFATNIASGVSGSLQVTLSNQIIPITSLTINGLGGITNINTAGGTLQMVPTIVPNNATNQNLSWAITGGAGGASINASTGLITAIANGPVVVTATTTDGTNLSASKIITITNQPPALTTGITVTGTGGASTITTNLGTLQMIATFTPSYTTNQNVTWSVTNGTGSATINASGLLSALADGTVTVVATAQDGTGISGSMVVTISNQIIYVTNVDISTATGLQYINVNNGTLQFFANVTPVNATSQNVVWTIINGTGSGTITPNTGLLTATGNGSVIVVGTATDGTGVFDTMHITIINQIVNTLVTGITINSLSNKVMKNNSMQMYSIITPALATIQTVTWSVINGSGAGTITPGGILTGTQVGLVTVIADANDVSGVSTSKVIEVIPTIPNGVEDFDISKIILSPNPFNNEIVFSNLENQQFEYSILNSLGQIVKLGKVSETNASISLIEAPTGTYFLNLSANHQVLNTYKVLKQ